MTTYKHAILVKSRLLLHRSGPLEGTAWVVGRLVRVEPSLVFDILRLGLCSCSTGNKNKVTYTNVRRRGAARLTYHR